MLDFSRFECLTFDCYGTIVDWETGILAALRPILSAHRRNLTDAGILELYGALESQEEQGEYKTYREVLRSVTEKFAARLACSLDASELDALPRSLPDWPPYADSVPALRQLKSRYQLAIISNTDDDLFAGTARHLDVAFDHVITAQQARAYKPSPKIFELALKTERIGLPRDRILHIGQSVWHDVIPAKSLGLATVWVNRRPGTTLFGSRPAPSQAPDLEVKDLKTLAAMAVGEQAA
ncbi:MAG TPA: haloacid dehalogenase type II [Terriglobales bacterium]|nr:haloacid dehalogenase type II [Terriglobales bacterium]